MPELFGTDDIASHISGVLGVVGPNGSPRIALNLLDQMVSWSSATACVNERRDQMIRATR